MLESDVDTPSKNKDRRSGWKLKDFKLLGSRTPKLLQISSELRWWVISYRSVMRNEPARAEKSILIKATEEEHGKSINAWIFGAMGRVTGLAADREDLKIVAGVDRTRMIPLDIR